MSNLKQINGQVLPETSDLALAINLKQITSNLTRLRRKGALLRTSTSWLSLIDTAISCAIEAQERLVLTGKRVAELERLSMTDELTGLLNRRGFENRLKGELTMARRDGEDGVLIFIDLDEFKAINDTYGHAAGDDVLRRVASLLCANVRESDCVGRLGGDEFVVLMPKSKKHNGLLRARSLDRVLNNGVAVWDGLAIPFRASCGVHTYAANADWREVLSGADAEMYRKKSTQRKRRAANDTDVSFVDAAREVGGGVSM